MQHHVFAGLVNGAPVLRQQDDGSTLVIFKLYVKNGDKAVSHTVRVMAEDLIPVVRDLTDSQQVTLFCRRVTAAAKASDEGDYVYGVLTLYPYAIIPGAVIDKETALYRSFSTITGNLGREPDARYLPDGKMVCNFSVAVNEGKDAPAVWFRVSLFDKAAETANTYLKKGAQTTVYGGTLYASGYTANDGSQRASLELRADRFSLPPKPGVNGASSEVAHPVSAAAGTDYVMMDEDVPF